MNNRLRIGNKQDIEAVIQYELNHGYNRRDPFHRDEDLNTYDIEIRIEYEDNFHYGTFELEAINEDSAKIQAEYIINDIEFLDCEVEWDFDDDYDKEQALWDTDSIIIERITEC